MRIGIVLQGDPTYSETFFQNKIIGLKKFGNEVMLFTNQSTSNFDLCRVYVAPKITNLKILQSLYILNRLLLLFIKAPKIVLKFYILEKKDKKKTKEIIENLYLSSHILSKKLDWVHFGFATTSIRRENVAMAINAKMGVSLRGYDISLFPLSNPNCYHLLWEKVDKIHTISDALKVKAINLGLSPQKAISKITPAIDTTLFQGNPLPLNFPSKIRFSTVARLKWSKGIEATLQALSIINNSGIDFTYTIIGNGEDYERLAFTAFQIGIAEKITWAGEISQNEIKEKLNNTDIYLQYSVQEGFCNSVLEAQSMGLLCIVSDAEGLPENVIHKRTGWVVPKRQPQLLADQIMKILALDEQELQKTRKNAVDRVRSEFNLEKQQQEFFKFYTE